MKIIAALIIISALLVGIVPQFTDCQSQGKAIQLPNGNSLPMKCHWTARSEIALAIPLLFSGVFFACGKRKETQRYSALMSLVLGVLIILMPTLLIGVCAKADMLCAAVMKPGLILTGGTVAVLSAVCLVIGGRQSASRDWRGGAMAERTPPETAQSALH